MNFGLLCDDPAAAPLLEAIQRSAALAVTRAVLISPETDILLHGLTGVRCTDRWEDLLAAEDLQAVIIGGSTPAVWDGAKQLASAGVPLLVLPTIAGGAASLYELSLIRDDTRGLIVPAWSWRFDPDIQELKSAWQTGAGPKVAYARWDVIVPGETGAEVPRAVIEDRLFHDADLWRFLCGAPDQVTALRTGGTATGAVIQSVVLAGRSQPELTWSIQAGPSASSRLTLHTDQGPRSTSLNDVPQAASVAELLQSFVTAMDRRSPPVLDWNAVLQAAEVVDAAQRSVERRRTIELHHETLSERAIFKTQMAAMGCGVLLLTLLLMLGYLALGSLIPLEDGWFRLLRLAVFAPLFLFLLMQFLLPLTRPATDSSSGESAPSP